MIQANGPCKTEVERLLAVQERSQGDLIASPQDLYDKADASIIEVNVKLQSTPALGGKDKWQMSRPKNMEPSLFSEKERTGRSGKRR